MAGKACQAPGSAQLSGEEIKPNSAGSPVGHLASALLPHCLIND